MFLFVGGSSLDLHTTPTWAESRGASWMVQDQMTLVTFEQGPFGPTTTIAWRSYHHCCYETEYFFGTAFEEK